MAGRHCEGRIAAAYLSRRAPHAYTQGYSWRALSYPTVEGNSRPPRLAKPQVRPTFSVASVSFVSYISSMSKAAAKIEAHDDQFPEEVRNQTTEALKRLRAADLSKPVDVYVNGTDNEPITLHPVVLDLITEVLARVSADQPVSIVTPDTIFTTQQAADMLNVSRPYLVRLIDQGQLLAEKVGRHRRIKASDLNEYRRRQQAAARAAARGMVDLTADWEGDD